MAIRKYKRPAYAEGGAVPIEPEPEKVAPPAADAAPPESPLAAQLEALKAAEEHTARLRREISEAQQELLSPQKREFLREHPELTTPGVAYEAAGHHWALAKAEGIADDTPEMFERILRGVEEEKARYAPPPAPPEARPEPPQRTLPVSAPVSREAPVLGTAPPLPPGKVRLSIEQRQHAAIAGVSEVEYARNLQRLNDLKAQGLYREQG